MTLDEDLRVKQRSPALEALLFRNTACTVYVASTLKSLSARTTAVRFEAFMADRGRVSAYTCTCEMQAEPAVAVQLFHSRLRGLGGQISHLVGICEEGDGECTRQPPDILLSEDLGTWTWPTAGGEDQSSSSSVMALSSDSSDSSETAFTVDAASPRLTMLSCTPSFTAFTGPMERGDVLDWVARGSADRLLALIQTARVGAPRSAGKRNL